jgi:hypothetical protein
MDAVLFISVAVAPEQESDPAPCFRYETSLSSPRRARANAQSRAIGWYGAAMPSRRYTRSLASWADERVDRLFGPVLNVEAESSQKLPYRRLAAAELVGG